MSPHRRPMARAFRRDVSAGWLAVPALLLVALIGALLLAGVLREMPAPSGTDAVDVAVPTPPADGA